MIGISQGYFRHASALSQPYIGIYRECLRNISIISQPCINEREMSCHTLGFYQVKSESLAFIWSQSSHFVTFLNKSSNQKYSFTKIAQFAILFENVSKNES